jgi:hypothetical protein
MPKYVEIESPKILERLVHTKFEDREKIDDLIKLERYVRDGAQGMAGNMQFRLLRSKYPEEFLAFLQSESPERYQAELQRQAEQKLQDQQAAVKRAKEIEEQRQDWHAAGGLR